MSKKFVRGVTGIEDIESYDKTLTNVNDILSDGQNTYVHTKKGKVESYYNLTDNVKTIQSSGGTITVEKDENGTVNLKTNPQKVLEHVNLLTDYGISKTSSGNTTKLAVEYSSVTDGFDLNNLLNGRVKSGKFLNSPIDNYWFFVSSFSSSNFIFQEAYTINEFKFKLYKRYKDGSVWQPWREQVGDKSIIDGLLAQKQNTLLSNASIGTYGTTLRQLYALKQTYNVTGGILKTHVKSISDSTNLNNPEEEFNFIVKINKGTSSVNFTLNSHDSTKFQNIITTYGADNTVSISGCVFTLSGATLTVSTTNNTAQNYVITFSDII